MEAFKFILEPYKPGGNNRYICPNCGKAKVFTRYIDSETGDSLAEHVGKCSRMANCGYHYTPANYFQDNPDYTKKPAIKPTKQAVPINITKTAIPIPKEYLTASRKNYEHNNLVHFLIQTFGKELTLKLIAKYHIGTSAYWTGSTALWWINTRGQVMAGQVVQFDKNTGSTIKSTKKDGSVARHTLPVYYAVKKQLEQNGNPIPDWLKKYEVRAEKFPHPFGLHLLKTQNKSLIAIVEAPKTAIICDAYFPEYTWMAIGSLSYLNEVRLKELKPYPIVLFPDASNGSIAYNSWMQKAKELRKLGYRISVSDLFELHAPEEWNEKGYDLADAILHFKNKIEPDNFEMDNPFFTYKDEMDEFLELLKYDCPELFIS